MAIPVKLSSTDGILSDERNWSELPQEILHLFSKKLPDISDFIRFRAVCKRWQLSAPVNNPPPQLPWLVECCEDPEHNHENPIIRFYGLLSEKIHTITCPGSYRAYLQGPACRYLLATARLRSSKMYLLNPLTNDQIHFPSVNVDNGRPDYIGADPIEGGNIVVISGIEKSFDNLNNPPYLMAFWRANADDWIYIEKASSGRNTYYMGQYFSSDNETGITDVIDIATKRMAYQVAPPESFNPLLDGYTTLVESGGKILRLFYEYGEELYQFDIHYLYFPEGEGKPCWVKITDIGDQMLFLQYYRGLSLCASNFSGFKGNCIYFLKMAKYKYLCRYDIGNRTTDVLPLPFDSLVTWFVPSLV